LEEVGILDKVMTVCTLDDVLCGKPEPELYLTAVGRLGIEPGQAVAFEDSPAGAESARRAGLTVVGVNQSQAVRLPVTHR
ncbi:HAD-IA family hydrolase, partial [Listeria monocytogenes]|nr:HAD-IA family hydrolase [Listeria monocytogenes]